MTFEEAIEALEDITQRLEEGNISLDKSLEQFEQGMKLIQFCEQKLEEVEKRIRILVEEDGKLKLKMAHFLEKENEAVEEVPETEEDDEQPLFSNGDS
jgi:exodeoxyribonuclease VII small subunit